MKSGTYAAGGFSERGSALLLVLWAIAFLSLVVLGVVQLVDLHLEEATAQAKDFRARQLAESGLAIGLHPQIHWGDSLLKQTVSPGEGFEVKMASEGSRLQINWLLANNQRRILLALFEKWNLSSDEANAVIDCLLDWVDADDLTHLNGAERNYYEAQGHPDYPRNAPFQSVDEMALVRGMDVVAKKKPDWRNYFTIWGDGKLDVNEASAELIEVVCGTTPEQAEAAVQLRNGPDGQLHTEDDHPFTNLNQFQISLGMTESDFQKIAGQLSFASAIQRIESTGTVGNHHRTIILIARRNVNSPQYLAWLEP